MHTKADDRSLRRVARDCLRTLGLHRTWKLGDVKWGEVPKGKEATCDIDLVSFTLDITFDYSVLPHRVVGVMFHELFHPITYPMEGIVTRMGSEALQGEFDEALEIAVDQLALVAIWMLKGQHRLHKRISILEGQLAELIRQKEGK